MLLPEFPDVLVPLGFMLSFGFLLFLGVLLSLGFLLSRGGLLFLGCPCRSEFEGKCSSQVSKKYTTSFHLESSPIPLRSHSWINLLEMFSRMTCSNRSVSVIFVAFEIIKGKNAFMSLTFLSSFDVDIGRFKGFP